MGAETPSPSVVTSLPAETPRGSGPVARTFSPGTRPMPMSPARRTADHRQLNAIRRVALACMSASPGLPLGCEVVGVRLYGALAVRIVVITRWRVDDVRHLVA